MRVGVSLRSAYPVDDVRMGARWMIERAAAAREAGLDSLFVGDHHGTGPHPYYQNTPIMGRLLAEWSDRPAGVLMLLALWNPVLAAEHLGTLASIATGPFVLQCSVGAGEAQFASMGSTTKGRAARFETTLDTIRRLLAGEEVGDTGVAPGTPEPLTVWIGATAPVAIDRAARLGDGWIADPGVVPSEAAELADRYRARCAEHGRPPGVVAIRRDVHVGADAADAERVAGPVLAKGYRGLRPDALTCGGTDEVAESLSQYAPMGYTDLLIRHLADDHTEVLRSFERLAAVRATLSSL
jgi:alkanesulfonate monooxygenase SsuD/methylene tetrahydromethanopterin reductase-like flavin-dependent oxidoreductase (luciferase family)